MEAQATGNKLHPVLWIAAIAVIILSAAGVAAIFGVIPTSGSASKQAEPVAAALPAPATTAAPVAAPAASAPAPKAAEPAAAEPKPAAKPAKPKVIAKAPESDSLPAPQADPKPAEPVLAQTPPPAPAPAICVNCGMIESVVEKTQKGEGSGIGAVAGGVAGAVLGSQVGKGGGKTAATVIGAAGGAVAGHQAERYIRKTTKWEVIVRFEDGTAREFDFNAQPAWRVGDRVKVENNVITAR